MQKHDDAVWDSLFPNNCNFMNKTNARTLCKNTYNLTGRCNRRSCPLANSRHATITQLNRDFYLHIKRTEGTIGWDLVQLRSDYHKALETIDKYLEDCPEALVHRVKRRLTKMTRIRDLTFKMREMTITDPSEKKKSEVAVLKKSYEIESLESRRKEVMRLKWHARKNPPRRVHAIGGRKVTQKSLQLMIPSRKLIMEPEIEYGESDNELQELDIEDLVSAKPLKDAGYGDIDEDTEVVGTSNLSMKRQPNVLGLDSGKSKRKPKAGTSDLPIKKQPNVFGLESGKSKRKPNCVY